MKSGTIEQPDCGKTCLRDDTLGADHGRAPSSVLAFLKLRRTQHCGHHMAADRYPWWWCPAPRDCPSSHVGAWAPSADVRAASNIVRVRRDLLRRGARQSKLVESF
jgi:hypothetical protein